MLITAEVFLNVYILKIYHKTERDQNLWRCYQADKRVQCGVVTYSRIWDIFANIWEIRPWTNWEAIVHLHLKEATFAEYVGSGEKNRK